MTPVPRQDAAAPPGWFLRLLAGVDSGAGAALAAVAWFAVHSRLTGEPWWAKYNLAAATFYGVDVFTMGRGRATAAGAALLFAAYTLLGVAFAFLAAGRGPVRSFLRACLWMACWHVAAGRYVWPWLDPSAPHYFPWHATVPAHLAGAILLARFPARLHRLRLLWEPSESGQAHAARSEAGGGDGPPDGSPADGEPPAADPGDC